MAPVYTVPFRSDRIELVEEENTWFSCTCTFEQISHLDQNHDHLIAAK